MMNDESCRWAVLINDEEQYALFPAELDMPSGWRPAGFRGTEDECVRYVDEHWLDMRPLSLRAADARDQMRSP